MRFRLIIEPFDDPNYIYELKHDGFRVLVYIEYGACKLISRNLRKLRFESLARALATLPDNAIIDGGGPSLSRLAQLFQIFFPEPACVRG